MADPVESFLSRLSRDSLPQVCLVQGDAVLAEPAARRIAQALAQGAGLPPEAMETYRRPANLASILQNLRTFSLFSPGKVTLAVDSAVFADRTAAGELIDDAAEAVPLADGGMRPLSARERQAASRLLQALYLFDVDAQAGAAEKAVGELPAWVLEGGKARRSSSKGRAKKQVEELRGALAGLLEAARREGLQGMGDSDLSELAEAIRGGLPPGHALVLAESAVATDHPVVRLLQDRGAVLSLGRVESERGSWQGLELLAGELERQTGVAIAPDALTELARRTLRQESDGRGRSTGGVDADSTARLAGEYRKLANMIEGERIDRKLVEQTVEDRGEEDVWQLLDAIAAGRGGEALDRLHRLIGAAEDPLAARLTFFSLLSSFCRQLVAIRGMMRVARVPAGEANYGRFKNQHAPALQGEAPIGGKNPLAGLHPFRLHRAYLAASRLPEPLLAKLPSDLLDTEFQLKGESGEADVALARLVAHLSQAGRRA
ncbi:MAG: polymerase subunit delta [Acidobacteriota bacterium]|jgi:DNA polymerase III delta subunit|nr:polymerase subunit delta [Acidobacteriota bacterium]